ncbi:MAG: helix-turn-helix transcriptional regulator [Chloroflexi bacterium]|nr:helix-turn-helix transcriptional regulator [Chloroflexota bacterium]
MKHEQPLEPAAQHPDQRQAFGAWIKQRRRALDLTQRMLAQRVGYALSTIRKIESGVLRPSRQVAEQLADALQIEAKQRSHFLHAARGLPAEATPTAIDYHADHGDHGAALPAQVAPLLSHQAELAEIRALLQDASLRLLPLYQALSQQERTATLLNNLGFTLLLLGDTVGAREHLAESLRLATALGDTHGRAFALNNLGLVALREGRRDAAAADLSKSLQLFWSLHDSRSCAECLEAVADLLLQSGQIDRVRAVLHAADQLREEIGAPRSEHEQTRYLSILNAAQSATDKDTPAKPLLIEHILQILEQLTANQEPDQPTDPSPL